MKPKLLIVGPLPPPFHGVTVSTSLVLANQALLEHFEVDHFDTSDHRTRTTVGKWELRNIWLALKHTTLFAGRLSKPKGIVYLPISAGLPGFLRDSLLINIARLRGWSVAGHFRNGDFHLFLRKQPRVIRAWLSYSARRMTAAGVLGESIKSDYAEVIDRESMTVVPNGTPDFDLHGADREESEVPRVLYLSNLRRRKGVVEAVRAAVLCLNNGSRARFTFVGEFEDDSLESELKHLAAPHSENIEFLPAVSGEAKERLYGSADIFVFPPVEAEGHPRVVLEAMAAGLPVITTARGAIPETVVHNVGGLVLDNPEPQALAANIAKLVDDGSIRVRMGKAARERYLEMYTEERADERLAKWLHVVAQEAGRAP